MKQSFVHAMVLAAFLLSAKFAHAADYVITLENQRFSPYELIVPAGHKVTVTVKNQDANPAEFESSALNREKVLPAKHAMTLFIGPLEVGSYGYCDDYRCDTTQGVITAK